MKDLYNKQKILLDLLIENIQAPLTIRQLCKLTNMTTPSLVFYHLKQLEKKGYLQRNTKNSKSYQVSQNGNFIPSYDNLKETNIVLQKAIIKLAKENITLEWKLNNE